MKFTSLDSRTDKGGGEVVATKSLKASTRTIRHSYGLRSEGGSIPKDSLEEGITFETGSYDPYFDDDVDLIKNSSCVNILNLQSAGRSPHRSLIAGG